MANNSVACETNPGIRFSAQTSVSVPSFSASVGIEACPRVTALPAVAGVSMISRAQPELLLVAAMLEMPPIVSCHATKIAPP